MWEIEYALCHLSTSDWTDRRIVGADSPVSDDKCGRGTKHYEIARVIMYMLPFWIRFIQSVAIYRQGKTGRTQFWNALKYVSALLVIITSGMQTWLEGTAKDTLRGIWILSLVIKTLYCYFWDLKEDWGFQLHGLSLDTFYRPTRLFSHPQMYHIAVVTNFLGRISWALAISPGFCRASCSLMLGLVEILRRSQWSVYRMERQQLKMDSLI